MLMTKRFDYVAFEHIHLHPSVANHRPLNEAKVAHYADDIYRNGLLEPLVVWEKNTGEFYLVGGFHRLNAIRRIRSTHPGYFDRVDVRVIAGDLDEIQALNLKLNADRLDARITDYFDAIVFMRNANWSTERIARFLDKPDAWVNDILRYAPGMDSRVRRALEDRKLSWAKAKTICKAVLEAPAGRERSVLEEKWRETVQSGEKQRKPRSLSARQALRNVQKHLKDPARADERYTVKAGDILALLKTLTDREAGQDVEQCARHAFPFLWKEGE